VLAYNDLVAVGAMDAIKQKGLSIPGDISVIGFDDIGLASEVNPTLTTVRVPKRMMGVLSVQRLIQVIKEEGAALKTLIPTKLVIRESSSKPKSNQA
jgi:LacI family transcriptional regulator